MDGLIRVVGHNGAVELLGVRLVGVTAENGKKLLLTITIIVAMYLVGRAVRSVATRVLKERGDDRTAFWVRQAVRLSVAVVAFLAVISIWFDDPTRLTTAMGLISAGLAFALQKVITAIAGYFVILRGKTFNIGDRIVMGGVRGDVIALDFTQTTIMEMGQPPSVQETDPAMWVRSRQYTGRVVTVTNARIFDEPVFNYTRDFSYIWEEMQVPIPYTADRRRAEEIFLSVVNRHAVHESELAADALDELKRRYFMRSGDIAPRIFWRLTDNWLELTARFVVPDHGIREVKDAISRDLLSALDQAGIGIASATFEIVGLPPLRGDRIEAPGGEKANGARRDSGELSATPQR